MTKYFYDTEFLEDGKTTELISIGIVADDGREYYAVNSEMPVEEIAAHDFLAKNVVPSLPLTRPEHVQKLVADRIKEGKKFHNYGGVSNTLSFEIDTKSTSVKPKWVIANEVREFLLSGDTSTELWAYYGAYDHVVLAQLFGPMIKLSKGIPMYTNDIMQHASRGLVPPSDLPKQKSGLHNALEDARHVKVMYDYIEGRQS